MWGAIGGAAVGVIGGAIVSGGANRAAKNAANAQADAARVQSDIAKEQWDRYKSIYAPLEDKYVQEAQDYGTPERYAMAAGDAAATVSDQFSKARDRLTRTPGIDPSSAGYASQITGLNLAQAATDATQQNMARRNVQDTAWARKTDALSLGKGLPAQAGAAASSAATQFGNIASNQQSLANQQASGFGNLASTVFNAGQKAGWFGGGGGTSSPATVRTFTNGLQDLTPGQMGAINL